MKNFLRSHYSNNFIFRVFMGPMTDIEVLLNGSDCKRDIFFAFLAIDSF